jgi:hypothetical protein
VKHKIWNERKVQDDESWQEIFRHFKQKYISPKNNSALIECSLFLSETNVAVESAFSLVNALRNDNRTWLEVCSAISIVLVKHCFRKYYVHRISRVSLKKSFTATIF